MYKIHDLVIVFLKVHFHILDIDMPAEAKRPRLATYEPEEANSNDVQSDAKGRSGLEPSEGSALPSVMPLDAIQVCARCLFSCLFSPLLLLIALLI